MKYPPIEPYRSGFLSVGDGHEMYWEESGSMHGLPVVFLHGGPGSGTDPGHREFFNPKKYRIVLLDQRGCGKSRPHSSLEWNTTWHLVADIEKLREHLQISQWVVFGGSWGSTLALTYAQSHPERVKALILRGIFLGRTEELRWFYQFGAHHLLPDAWEQFIDPIPLQEREDLIEAYYRRLTSEDPAVRRRASSAWAAWEGAALRLRFNPEAFAHFVETDHADAIARIECHYFRNRCFFPDDRFLLDGVSKIRKIPARLIQGRYDLICPVQSAWQLHQRWPEAELEIVPDAGHASGEPGILQALMSATEFFSSP